MIIDAKGVATNTENRDGNIEVVSGRAMVSTRWGMGMRVH